VSQNKGRRSPRRRAADAYGTKTPCTEKAVLSAVVSRLPSGPGTLGTELMALANALPVGVCRIALGTVLPREGRISEKGSFGLAELGRVLGSQASPMPTTVAAKVAEFDAERAQLVDALERLLIQERDVRQLSRELDTLLPSMSRVQAFGVTPPRRHALPAEQRGPLDALRNHDLNKQRLLPKFKPDCPTRCPTE
jgi:hypothetical protein